MTPVDIGDGLHVATSTWGTEGPAVVFLHGSGPGASGPSNFAAPAERIAAKGYRCITLDTMGYGDSSRVDRDHGLDWVSECAAKTLEQLGIQEYVLVGNSHGGAQAIRIALEHPDRVRGLLLMAPGGLEERDVYMEMRGVRSMLRCIYGPEGITLAGMMKVFGKQLYSPQDIDPALVERRFEVAMTQSTRTFRTLAVTNQRERLGELTCPVLGLWGANDQFCPPSGALHLATGCTDVEVVVYGRCGHWVMVEQADAFVEQALRFLGKLGT
ncbi:MAG: alpha/beta fold hydrolase [Proteobacteria bacterium]|nr:alpha/beta fold hydrolase [Pseudomonadota bacterium]MCP4922098.1 alpha/beta fold hydrolase [Pseudomonadota bacterium]